MSDAFSFWLMITGVFLVTGLVNGITSLWQMIAGPAAMKVLR